MIYLKKNLEELINTLSNLSEDTKTINFICKKLIEFCKKKKIVKF